MLQKILQWLKGLTQQQSAPQEPEPSQPEIKPLSDADYEILFLRLLEKVAADWEQARILEYLGERSQDRFFKSWLRRFGKTVLSSPVPNRQLAERMVKLGDIGCGEIGEIAREIGRQQLAREFEPLNEAEWEELFKQLLQRVGRGREATVEFLEDLEGRATGEQWGQWFRGYQERLLASKMPDYQLAGGLLELAGQLESLPEFGDLAKVAGQVGSELRVIEENLQIWEYDGPDA